MSRIQFKLWMAPGATLEASLTEGEMAIRQEDGVIVRRPDGNPTGTLVPVGAFPAATATTAGSVRPDGASIVVNNGVMSVEPNFVASQANDLALAYAIALG